MVDARIALDASRLLIDRAATRTDPATGLPDPELAAIAKIHAAEMAIQVTSQALQIHGAAGYSRNLRLERLFRDAGCSPSAAAQPRPCATCAPHTCSARPNRSPAGNAASRTRQLPAPPTCPAMLVAVITIVRQLLTNRDRDSAGQARRAAVISSPSWGVSHVA